MRIAKTIYSFYNYYIQVKKMTDLGRIMIEHSLKNMEENCNFRPYLAYESLKYVFGVLGTESYEEIIPGWDVRIAQAERGVYKGIAEDKVSKAILYLMKTDPDLYSALLELRCAKEEFINSGLPPSIGWDGFTHLIQRVETEALKC
jgi:hypothetical protein